MTQEVQYEEFLPRVFVYKNLIPNPQKIVEQIKFVHDNPGESILFSGPDEWGVFGYLIHMGSPELMDVSVENCESEQYKNEVNIHKEIWNAFNVATSHYLDSQGVEKESDWKVMGPSLSTYHPTDPENYRGRGEHGDLAMAHHTDYEQLKAEMPGNKFILTCTMYLNDDYEKGGVDFLANGESHLYTPKAGDVVVFPSGHPKYFSEGFTYYHGVQEILGSDKHFIRCFYQKPYAGSEEWLANQSKYGEEVWAEMEKARIIAGLKKQPGENTVVIDNAVQEEIDSSKECGLEEFKS
jgi:hypothetical protein